MRLLADENLHADLVEWLRSIGHDVVYAAETLASESDEVVLRHARDEDRIVVTDDKDFGDLVVRRRLATAGVLLLRQSGSDSNTSESGRLDQLCWRAATPS